MQKKMYIFFGILLIGITAKAQDILTKQDAVTIALENNYDIRVTKNNVETAKNNTSIYNSGYLPTVTANAGYTYNSNDTDSEIGDGTVNSFEGAESQNYNASIGINYTLFDGFNRKYSLKRLKESYNLTEVQARQVMENTLVTLFFAYYEVARLTENEASQKETLEISKERLTRVNYSFEYGQNTKLDVLNAEVDVNNDNVNYLEIKRQLANAKRDLNVVLGRDVTTDVTVDTTVTYTMALTLEELLNTSLTNNATLLQARKNITLSQYDVKINNAGWMPNVSLTGSYAWRRNINDALFPFSLVRQTTTGLSAGVNLSWNIFDAGRTKTNVQNARIALSNQEILKEQQEEQLKRDVNNAWETYQNLLFTLQVQETNVQTNKRNFERTNERYKLGQVTSIDFRQAQINLINAELSLSQAKYNAKNAELELLRFAGTLTDHPNF